MWHNHVSGLLEMVQAQEFSVVIAGIFAALSFKRPPAGDITPLVHYPPSNGERDFAFLNRFFAVPSPHCITSKQRQLETLTQAQSEKLEKDIEQLISRRAQSSGVPLRSERRKRVKAKRRHLVVSSMTQHRPIKPASQVKITTSIGARSASFSSVTSTPIRATPQAAKVRPIGRSGKRVVNRTVRLHAREHCLGARHKPPSGPNVAVVSISSVVASSLQNAA